MAPESSVNHQRRGGQSSRSGGHQSSRQISINSNSLFEDASYGQVDSEQRQEFEQLLKKESSWYRSCLHKGLIANIIFFLIMILGIVLGEVLFPLEGLRGRNTSLNNDTTCTEKFEGCITVRIIRAVGVFGFLGGLSNWIAVEMLFRSVPFLIGTGVIAKQYKEIREGIHTIVVETLFDPVALKEHFSGRKKYIQEMLHLEHHFGSLLNSEAANRIIERKINLALARPEGFILNMMGIDQTEVRPIIKRHVQGFLTDMSPLILDKMAVPGLTDGAGMQAEMERILEERVEELSSTKVKQLIAIMIRKHLSWLIVWGNIFGALIGLVAEIVAVLVANYTRN